MIEEVVELVKEGKLNPKTPISGVRLAELLDIKYQNFYKLFEYRGVKMSQWVNSMGLTYLDPKTDNINNLHGVIDFIKTNGRLPLQSSSDDIERGYAKWLVLKRRARKGKDRLYWNDELQSEAEKMGFPHLFKGLSHKGIDTHMKDAENLSLKYGELPNSQWLDSNGYTALRRAISKYPEFFQHLKRKKKSNSIKDYIILAEGLEDEYEKLPNLSWLRRNGYRGLAECIQKHPCKFKHIMREREEGVKILEKHLSTARALEKENGRLPNVGWLIKNGYSDLEQYIRKYPEKFKLISQDSKKGKSLDYWVSYAEVLQKKYGHIPSKTQLLLKKEYAFLKCMSMYPSKFKRFKRGIEKRKSKRVVAYLETEKLEYDSVNEAAREVNVTPSAIRRAIKTKGRSKGYYWKYIDE